MRLFLQATIQAILNADAAAGASGHNDQVRSLWGKAIAGVSRVITTRLGPISVHLPENGSVLFQSEVLTRYTVSETNLLLLMARILVQGRASIAIVEDIARILGANDFNREQMAAITAAINAELPAYRQRELERERNHQLTPRSSRPDPAPEPVPVMSRADA